MNRLTVSDAERAELWGIVATNRRRAGDRAGAQMARWTARSIRSEFPLNVRPEDLRP